MSSGTSKDRSRGRRGSRSTAPAPVKPRTLEHFCKLASLVAKGDERDCPLCTGTDVTPESVEHVRARARGERSDPRLKGAGAREMGRYDINGKPWGYKPINSYIRGWRPKR